MMYWIGFALLLYAIVALFIFVKVYWKLRYIIAYRTTTTDDKADVIATSLYCSLFWPLAIYRGHLEIRL